MKDYELTYINQFKTGKDGKPYLTKTHQPFVRVSVKVPEHGDAFVGGLWFGADCPWKVGDKVTMRIYEEEYQGKKSLKFELPKKENPNQKYFEEINGRLLKIEMGITEILGKLGDNRDKKPEYPIGEPLEPNFDTKDLPF
jgi:hypothetical protein